MKHLYFLKTPKFFILLCVLIAWPMHTYAQVPTDPSSKLTFSNLDGNRFRVSFTRGNGTNRIIVAKADTPVTAIPADGTDYLAGAFGEGNELAPGEFVVYKGNSSATTITGLTHSTTYHLRIYDFNGSDFSTQYLTTNYLEGSQATVSNPTEQSSDITFTEVLGSTMRVNWTKGNGTGRMLIARANNPVNVEPQDLENYNIPYYNNFGISSSEMGAGNFAVYAGTGTTIKIQDLEPNTTYHFALFEYNGSSGKVFLTSTSMTSPTEGARASQVTNAYPTKNASAMTFGSVDANRFSMAMNTNQIGDGEKRIVVAKKGSPVTAVPVDGSEYSRNLSFGSGHELAPGEYVVFSGSGTMNQTLTDLEPHTDYYFKAYEYNGSGTNTYYLKTTDGSGQPVFETSQSTVTFPTTQASNISFSDDLVTSIKVNWTKGDGTGRILIARANEPVNVEPQDLVNYYSPYYNDFGMASAEIGTGNYVVYAGTAASTKVTALEPNTTYHFALFEYNGNSGKIYLTSSSTSNPAAGATAQLVTSAYSNPTVNTKAISFGAIDGNRFHFRLNSNELGNGEKRMVVAKQGSPVTGSPTDGMEYTPKVIFGEGSEIAPGEFVITNESSWINNRTITGLQPHTTYYFKVFEYNGTDDTTVYLTTKDSNDQPVLEAQQATVTYPDTQASNMTFSDVLGSSMKINWTNGNGSGRLLIARAGSPVNVEPQDLINYSNNGNGFGQSSYEIGTGNYVLYTGNSSGTTIGNLDPDETYHFALFEYNGSSGKVYLTSTSGTNPAPGSTANQSTNAYPTQNTTAIEFGSFDGNRFHIRLPSNKIGNGEKRLVIIKEGSPVTAVPINGQEYTAQTTFGNGQEIAPGEFVITNESGWINNRTISGLQPHTTYYFKVYEYNGSGDNTYYLVTEDANNAPVLEANQATISYPSVQTKNIFVNSKTTTSFNINWTKGDGSQRILIARANQPVDVEPEDLINYPSSTSAFGKSPYEIGTGNYVLYAGNGVSANITNLEPGTNYHFALFEYNGNSGKAYLRPGYRFEAETFGERPTVQVSNVLFEELGASSMRIKFNRGNGSSRLVLAKKESPVDVLPDDLTSYTANENFGQGQQVGSGNYVVYNGTQENFQLSNLEEDSSYHFAFFEYAINQDQEYYLTPGFIATEATPDAPSVLASNFSYTRPCDGDLILKWTSGNGKGRLVVLSEAPLNDSPLDGTDYNANFSYGSGDAIGNGFVIYNAAGNLVPPNGLQASTNYYVNVFEYNGTKADPIFNTTPLQGFIGDITAPSVSCKNIEVILDADGNASITPEDVGTIPTGDCGPLTSTIDISSFDCSHLGPNDVTLTITDSEGNTSSCVSVVTVLDQTPPTVITKNMTIQLDASGKATIDQDAVDNGSTDACGPLTFVTDRTTFNSSHIGENTVTLTVTDAANNSSFATAIVTVEDGCLKPTDLASNNIGVTSAELSWTAGHTETTWIVKFSDIPNFNPETEGQSQTVEGSATTQLQGLTANTEYQFYVKADCGADEESNFAGPFSFSSLCLGAPTLSFLGTGEYENSIVTPTQGTPETTYEFAVVYSNEEGTLPPYGFPRILLDYEGNGRFTDTNDRAIILSEAEPGDQDTTNGKIYTGTISQLPSGQNWQAWVQVQATGCTTDWGPFDVPEVLIAPDLEIFANDIVFDNPNPEISSPLQITATIHNRSDLPANNFVVHIENQFDTTAVYPDKMVEHLGPHQSTTVQWNIITPAIASWNPMEVFVDYTNVITETNELNNRAIRPFTNGDFNLPGAINIRAKASPAIIKLPSGTSSVSVSGHAYYTDTAIQLQDSTVAGATVSFTNPITGGRVQTHTNSRGYFSFRTPSGSQPGNYSAALEVTDFTLTGAKDITWELVEGPCLPDLSVRFHPNSQSILVNDTASGTIVVKNSGCAAVEVETLLEMNQTGGLPIIPNMTIPPLQPGESYSQDFTVEFDTVGSYYIKAHADAEEIVVEASENNNFATTTIKVNPRLPDITPTGGGKLSSRYLCNPGNTTSFGIKNIGYVATGAFKNSVAVYFGNNLVTTYTDLMVQDIQPGASTSVTIPFEYDQAGRYEFVLTCDSEDAVLEISESNNSGNYHIDIKDCQADLFVSSSCDSFVVDPIDPNIPGTVTYTAEVGNKGNATATAPVEFQFSLSNGELYTLVHNEDILPGQRVTFSTEAPAVTSGGTILTARVDPNQLISDSNRNNNETSDTLCWEFEPVPLCGYDFWNTVYHENESTEIAVGLKAQHLYRASKVTVRFEVSGPGINGWALLGDASVENVNNCSGCPYRVALPARFVFNETGVYTFRMTADPDNAYDECDEDNNVLIKEVTVANQPDMRILSQYINPTLLNPEPGQSIFFDISYENIGYSNINDTMDLTVLINDNSHAVVQNVTGLIKNKKNTIAIPVPYASEIEGLHVVRAIIDSNQEVNDRNRNNNEATRSFVVGAAANLSFNQFTASNQTPNIGENITIDANIVNNGELDVDAEVLVSYISAAGDTIRIGTKPITVLLGDQAQSSPRSSIPQYRSHSIAQNEETISIPWTVAENPVRIIGEILNSSELEFDYTDNFASTQLNAYDVALVVDSACEGQNMGKGMITAEAEHGTAPYAYYWSNGYNGRILEAEAGTYSVTVIDAVGTRAVATATIDEDPNCSAPICSLSAVDFEIPDICDPATGIYTTTVTVAYTNAPSQGSISVNGTNYPITSSPQHFKVDFVSGPVTFNIHFTEDDGCNLTIPTDITLAECEQDCEGTYGGAVLPGTVCTDDNGNVGILDENCLCDITMTSPANDDLCDAIPLTLGATSAGDAYTNLGATAQTNEPRGSCWTGSGNLQSVWFSFEAPNSGKVNVSTNMEGGTLQSQIAIYEAATDCEDLATLGIQVYCNEDEDNENSRPSSNQNLSDLTPGAHYFVQVAGMDSQIGTFGIEISEGTLSVDQLEKDFGLQVYPNPAQSGAAFHVATGQFAGQTVQVSITDALGKMVYKTRKLFDKGHITIQTDRALESGVYFVHLTADGAKLNKRLIIK